MDPITMAMMGLSAYTALSGKKSKGGTSGGMYIQQPPAWWTESQTALANRERQNMEYLDSTGVSIIGDRWGKTAKKYADRVNLETTYGTPGDRRTGEINMGLEAGAALGVGPKAGAYFSNKAMARYKTQAMNIQNEIANAQFAQAADSRKSSAQVLAGQSHGLMPGMPYAGAPAQEGADMGWLGEMAGSIATLKGGGARTASTSPGVASFSSSYLNQQPGSTFGQYDAPWDSPNYSALTSANYSPAANYYDARDQWSNYGR